MLISCFLFLLQCRISLYSQNLIRSLFYLIDLKNPLDKRLSGLLAVIQDARINGTISNFLGEYKLEI